MIPYPAAGIHAYRNGIPFSTLGWGHHTPQPTSPPTQPLIPITTPDRGGPQEPAVSVVRMR
jgi:hypothetical protein